MAIAKKCDRCGKMYEKYNEDYSTHEKNMNGFASICVSTNGGNYIVQEVYDLCEECKESLKDWFHNGDIILHEKVIQEFESSEKNGPPLDEYENAECSVIIQEPESDGDEYV